MDREYDVVVVGAGPGGSTTAAYLGRAGVRTLLTDKAHFPRDKSCGDAVCSRSVALVKELGLEDELSRVPGHRALGEVFINDQGEGLHLPFVTRNATSARVTGKHQAPAPAHAKHRIAVMADMADDKPPAAAELVPCPAYVIAREIFDDLLFRHARSYDSVETLEGFAFTDFLRDSNGQIAGVIGKDEHGHERKIRARIVIGADGAMSKVAEKAGAYDFHHKNHDHWIAAFRIYFDDIGGMGDDLELHFLDGMIPGYLWIFPEGNGRANVGAGMVESFARGENGRPKIQIKQRGYELLANHPRLRERFKVAREVPDSFLGWQLPCGSERRKIAGEGWMLVGDAASLIDPFSGEGIANAMASGKIAATTAANALKNGGDLSSYETAVWQELGAELDTSTKLQKLARHAWLVKWLLHRAATRPKLMSALQDLKINDEGRKLTNPLYLARMLMM